MSMIHSAAGLRYTTDSSSRVVGFLTRCWAVFQEWRERGRSEVELCSLSDAALMDLGVARGEIEFLITDREKRGVRSR